MVGTITANFYTATNFETLVSANVFQILNVHLGYLGLECFLKRYRFYRLETFGLTKLSMIASYDYWVVLWTIFQSVPRYNLVPSHFTIVLKLSQNWTRTKKINSNLNLKLLPLKSWILKLKKYFVTLYLHPKSIQQNGRAASWIWLERIPIVSKICVTYMTRTLLETNVLGRCNIRLKLCNLPLHLCWVILF